MYVHKYIQIHATRTNINNNTAKYIQLAKPISINLLFPIKFQNIILHKIFFRIHTKKSTIRWFLFVSIHCWHLLQVLHSMEKLEQLPDHTQSSNPILCFTLSYKSITEFFFEYRYYSLTFLPLLSFSSKLSKLSAYTVIKSSNSSDFFFIKYLLASFYAFYHLSYAGFPDRFHSGLTGKLHLDYMAL